MGSPQVSGGMTAAEFQAQLDLQQQRYEDLIDQQNKASIEAELARQQADEMQAAREIQQAAAEESAINAAQEALDNEMNLTESEFTAAEKADLQGGFNALFQSFVSGLPYDPGTGSGTE